jgi:hypothetical protein
VEYKGVQWVAIAAARGGATFPLASAQILAVCALTTYKRKKDAQRSRGKSRRGVRIKVSSSISICLPPP